MKDKLQKDSVTLLSEIFRNLAEKDSLLEQVNKNNERIKSIDKELIRLRAQQQVVLNMQQLIDKVDKEKVDRKKAEKRQKVVKDENQTDV